MTGCDRLTLHFLLLQVQCEDCGHWMNKEKANGHKKCHACRYSHPSIASSIPLPDSPSPPPVSIFNRPDGCMDQLTQVERAAIITLHKVEWNIHDIAQSIKCSE